MGVRACDMKKGKEKIAGNGVEEGGWVLNNWGTEPLGSVATVGRLWPNWGMHNPVYGHAVPRVLV